MEKEVKYYPLTHPQKAIWYTEKMYPGTSIGNVAGSLRIKGNVDYSLLERAINVFIEKNDGIRLRITEINGEPMQFVSVFKERKIDFLDFSGENGTEDLYKWDEEQTQEPMNLIDSDLFYFAMIKVNGEDGGFYAKTHHLISDAWSMTVIGNQVIGYYTSLKEGKVITEDKKPSYIDFVLSEQEYKNSNRFKKDKEYWEEKFENFSEITTLKTRTINYSETKSKRKTLLTPIKFTKKLREYSEQNKISIFALFISALSMYINRIASKEDLTLGTTILNRTNSAEKSTMGMFISTVPIRLDIVDTMNFSSFSQLVSKELMSFLRHQKYPYDLLLKEVRKKHNISENLYDIVLSYQNSKFNKTEHSEEYSTRWHFNGHQTNSLTIHINDREDEGHLIIDYDFLSDLFHVKEIEFIHQHIVSLLWHAIDNPDRDIAHIEMLSEREKHKILYEFNNTKADYPKEKTIHQLFEEQVERTPDNIAVVFEDKKLTYRELNEKANQLARVLRNKGIKPDTIVGIMVHRSLEMIVGIMGILKAGGAYMPIDPEYPQDRIEYMLEDSGANILLTQHDLREKVLFNGSVIEVDDKKLYSGDITNLDLVNKSTDLIYVIYTSGSTGRPKGVMIEHYSVVNRLNWMQKKYPIYECDAILQKTPFTFDVSVWELFWWSLVGAKVVLLKHGEEKQPNIVVEAISKNNITTMHFVPSMLNAFLDYISEMENAHKLASLKQVFASGEALTSQQVEKFNEILFTSNNTRLFNLYGPTEATVDVSYFNCSDGQRHKVIPIGKPIDNIQLYILDKNYNIQPIGVAGELYIAGDGLARGYINKVELTKDRFVENPFKPGERMYKTGDLARWFSEGDIEYLGRIDHQVKIRGFRIELNEIQELLHKHESIKNVVVVCKEKNDGEKFICAYVVLKDKLTLSNLKDYLLKYLPSYMIPAFFVELENIPLSHNGKVNSKLLPEPAASLIREEIFIEPRNDIEEFLLKLWMKNLEVKKISVKDNFFDLGGDSITAIKLISEIGSGVTFMDFYQNPTIEMLANVILNKDNSSRNLLVKLTSRINNKKGFDKINVICFPYGGGNSGIYQDLANSLSQSKTKCGVYSVNLPGHDIGDTCSEFTAIGDIAKEIVNEIKNKVKGDIILYGHCVGSALTIEVARLLTKMNANIKAICIGASLPPRLVKYYGKIFDPWKFIRDREIIKFLNKIGLPEFDLKNEDMKVIMRAFRYDVKSFYKYFYNYYWNINQKLNVPLYCIVGENDPLTQNYKKGYKNWEGITDDVRLCILKGADHYFIKTHSEELAKIINEIQIAGGEQVESTL